MASSRQAARLTEQHRLAQARLGARTVRDVLTTFKALDPENLDATSKAWLRIVVPIIRTNRATSSDLSAEYLAAFRALELGRQAKQFDPVLANKIATDQIITSLTVTGPVALKRAMQSGLLLERAFRQAQAGASSAAMRLTLNGGRDTVLDSLAADKQAIGWARKTSGNPCAFCAMLASRGPVYKSKEIGERITGRKVFTNRAGEDVARGARGRWTSRLAESGRFSETGTRGTRAIGEAYHDHCQCTAEPIYSAAADWPDGSRHYADLWKQAKTTKTDHSVTDFNAFRRLIEGRA